MSETRKPFSFLDRASGMDLRVFDDSPRRPIADGAPFDLTLKVYGTVAFSSEIMRDLICYGQATVGERGNLTFEPPFDRIGFGAWLAVVPEAYKEDVVAELRLLFSEFQHEQATPRLLERFIWKLQRNIANHVAPR